MSTLGVPNYNALTLEATRIEAFDDSAITLTLPNSTSTVVGIDTTDTLTNKTITDVTNNVWVDALKYVGGQVAVDVFNAPLQNQTLGTNGWFDIVPGVAGPVGAMYRRGNVSTEEFSVGADGTILKLDFDSGSFPDWGTLDTVYLPSLDAADIRDGTGGFPVTGIQTDIVFSTITNLGNAFSFTVGDTNLTVLETGDYDVYFKVGVTETAAVEAVVTYGLYLNGGLVTSSTFDVPAGSSSVNSNGVTLPITANDVLGIKIQLDSGTSMVTTGDTSCLVVSKIKGPAGPRGPIGNVGAIDWNGEWASLNYEIGDSVYYAVDGNAYICTANTTTLQPPTDAGFWDRIAEKGLTPDGTQVVIRDNGAGVVGSPFVSFNFRGTATSVEDGGGGEANVSVDISSAVSSNPVATFLYTSGTTSVSAPNTFVQIPFNQNPILTSIDFEFVNNGARVLFAGKYDVTYFCTTVAGNRTIAAFYLTLNGSEIAGTRAYTITRNTDPFNSTGTSSVILDLAVDDVVAMEFGYIASSTTNITMDLETVGTGMNVTKLKGDTGAIGQAGDAADFNVQGLWVNQNYVLNDLVFYEPTKSGYRCKLSTTASQDPTDATYWDLVVDGGVNGPDGVGSNSLILKVNSDNVDNTPHQTLNFTGSNVTVTDAGSGVAQVSINKASNLQPAYVKYRTTSTQNLDNGVTITWDIQDFIDSTNFTFTGGNTINITNTGVYEIIGMFYITSNAARNNTTFRFQNAGGNLPGKVHALVRNNQGNDEAGVRLYTIESLTAGATITVLTAPVGTTNNTTLVSGESMFMIKRLDSSF